MRRHPGSYFQADGGCLPRQLVVTLPVRALRVKRHAARVVRTVVAVARAYVARPQAALPGTEIKVLAEAVPEVAEEHLG